MWLLGELLTCCPWKCCILCFTYHWPPWAPPPEPTGFPQPFLSLGCKRYTPSLQRPCPYPKKQWDYREKNWAKLLVCDCCSCCWHHRAGGWRRSAPSCPLPSHGPDGWWKHVFCHLQTIFCLGRSAACKTPVGGTVIPLILKPESGAMERSSAEKESSLAWSGQH